MGEACLAGWLGVFVEVFVVVVVVLVGVFLICSFWRVKKKNRKKKKKNVTDSELFISLKFC